MRRFETPAAPPGWAGQGAELLRIVAPTGRGIAWLAPAYGAAVVGYAIRRADGSWHHLLHSGSLRDQLDRPLAYGIAVLGPEPDGSGSAHRAPWRFVERDPTMAACAATLGPTHLALTARLEDTALHLALHATTDDAAPSPILLGFRLLLASGFRRTDHSGTFVSTDDSRLRLSLMASGGAGAEWRRNRSATGTIAVEAQRMAAPAALGGTHDFTLVIAAEEEGSRVALARQETDSSLRSE